MKIDTALLCDAVTSREGLINILGGGVTRIRPSMYPTQYQGALALQVLIHPTEATTSHTLRILLQAEDGQRLMEIEADIASQPSPDLALGEQMSIPVPVTFGAQLPEAGTYSFEVLIDNIHQRTVVFRAMPI